MTYEIASRFNIMFWNCRRSHRINASDVAYDIDIIFVFIKTWEHVAKCIPNSDGYILTYTNIGKVLLWEILMLELQLNQNVEVVEKVTKFDFKGEIEDCIMP